MTATARTLIASLFVGTALLAGCSSGDGDGGDSGPAGVYAPGDGSSNIIRLRSDGTFCGLSGEQTVTGTWEQDGADLFLTIEDTGDTFYGELEGDTITQNDGQFWVKTDDPPADC